MNRLTSSVLTPTMAWVVCGVAWALLLLCWGGVQAAHAQSLPGDRAALLDEAQRLNAEVIALYRAGRIAEAVPLARRVLVIRERALGPEHPDVATSLNNLALLYQAQGQYAQAVPLFRRSLAIREKALGPEHPEVGTSLNDLAQLYQAQGQYAQAEPLHRRALAIREKALGPEHPEVGTSLNDLAQLYQAQGQYAQAEPLHRRALAIWEKARGPDHPDVATSLNNLALLYLAQGQYTQAEPLFRRALAIWEKARGPDHPDVATSLNNLGGLYELQGRYAQAVTLHQRALAIRERALGAEHPDVGQSLENLAAIYDKQGQYAQAELLRRRALAILEKALGPEHPDVGQILNNLAALYQERGQYAQAEPLYRRALAILEKALGAEHPRVAVSVANLAGLYAAQGQVTQAEPLYRRALAIREKALGPAHPDVGRSLNNLAWLYQSTQGQVAQAEPLYRRALAIWEKTLGPEHPDVAKNLDNLATLYKTQGQYTLAEPLYRRALAIQEQVLGPAHPDVATSLNNLAGFHAAQGQYTEAAPLYRRALAIQETALGPEHPDVGQILNNLATLYWAQGQHRQAIGLLARAAEVRERAIALILGTGSESRKRSYLATLAGETDAAISLHVVSSPRDPDALHLALTTVLRRRGRALDAMADTLAVARRRLRPEQQAILEEWARARTAYAGLVLGGPGADPLAEHRAHLARLATRIEELEAQLGDSVSDAVGRTAPVTLERVQQAIPAEAALVEIAAFHPFDARATRQPWGPARYVAYLLARDRDPAWVDLGEAAVIDAGVVRLREAMSDPRRGDVKTLARALDELVMEPIRGLLGDRRRLLVSPDGALNLVPFAALVDEHGQYLAERYTVSYLTSGRDLLRLRVKRPSRQGWLVVADPDFDDRRGGSAQQIAGAAPPPGSRRSADFGRVTFPPLPGTAGEARAIVGLLPATRVLSRADATESALKGVLGPQVLHVATHGFFLADQAAEPAPPGVARDWTERVTTEHPLLRSGLALAGANRLASGGEDGILTALEASGLDLTGTQLVVLSACETGVGAVSRGEGVYGLRRALVIAGAESQVMSLWQVEDAATRDLMAAYYRRLLRGEGRAEALRQAQREVAGSSGRSHPFFWASFVPIGDWAPITTP